MGATTVTLRTGDAWNTRGNRRSIMASVAGSTSYATNGDTVTAANFGLVTIDDLVIMEQPSGYSVEYDRTNKKFKFYRSGAFTVTGAVSTPTFTGTANVGTTGTIDDNDNAATLGHALYVMPVTVSPAAQVLVAESSATGLVKHSATAAADGVAIYVVVDDPNWSNTYQLGHLEFVSPTNANGSGTIANGAATITLFDDDAAASNGVAVRAVAASGGLEATTGASKDILVQVSTGKYIHVNHATTGATPELYFDEDAANTYDRIQGVIVDTADEPYKLFVASLAATEDVALSPIQAGPRLASIVTVGPKPFSYIVGVAGPEITVASRPDVATLPGAVALYVQAAGAGFNAANYGKEDLFVPVSNGEFIKIAYAASPAGVQVYGYPEGATADLKILGVIVDNLDETYTTEAALGWRRDTPAGTISTPTFTGDAVSQAALVEVTSTTNLSGVAFDVEAIGW